MANLKILREANKISQLELALYIGTTVQTISHWEQGDSEPDIKSIKKIATFFHTTIDFLLNYKPENI